MSDKELEKWDKTFGGTPSFTKMFCDDLRDSRAEIAQLKAQLVERESEIERKRDRLAIANCDIGDLQQQLAERDARIAELEEMHESRNAP